MPQIFHRSFNTLIPVGLLGGPALLLLLAGAIYLFYQSPYATSEEVVLLQDIPFSHEHHVGRLGFDCRYCHASVENSSYAGMPATDVCMNCHSQIWVGSEMLRPVRESYRTGRPLKWRACITCRISSTSITRSTSPREWAARSVMAVSTACLCSIKRRL